MFIWSICIQWNKQKKYILLNVFIWHQPKKCFLKVNMHRQVSWKIATSSQNKCFRGKSLTRNKMYLCGKINNCNFIMPKTSPKTFLSWQGLWKLCDEKWRRSQQRFAVEWRLAGISLGEGSGDWPGFLSEGGGEFFTAIWSTPKWWRHHGNIKRSEQRISTLSLTKPSFKE